MGIIRRRFVAGLLFCTLILAACARPLPPTPTPLDPPAATPTAPATALPSPTALLLPTSTLPPLADLLPAPLYFIDAGQIQRLEIDGVTRRRITNELAPRLTAGAVREFDIAPNGDLAYVIATREGGTALITSDALGRQRRVLYERPGVDISNPRIAPDGRDVAVRLTPDPARVADLFGGVYLLPLLPHVVVTAPATPLPDLFLPFVTSPAAQPRLLHPDDILDANANPPSRQFIPLRWSPDGKRLVFDGLYFSNTTCSLALKDLESGALLTPGSPIEDAVLACGTAVWTRDGSTLMTNLQPLGMPVLATGLWQVLPWDGPVVPLLSQQAGEQRQMIIFPHQTASDGIYMFLTRTTQQPDPSYSPPLRYTMHQYAFDGSIVALRDDSYDLREAQWAADDSGAAIVYVRDLTPALAWLPANGDSLLPLDAEGSDLFNLRWGNS
jgi:hypothetical protein